MNYEFTEQKLAFLKSVLEYDPVNGTFTRKDGKQRTRKLKDPAKTAKSYKQINVDGVIYNAHILAWWFMTGAAVPAGLEIDHKDRDRQNFKWNNLRLLTRGRNTNNLTVRSDNRSGITGVGWNKNEKHWYAHITVDGKSFKLGSFEKFADAVSARLAGEMHHFDEIYSTHAINGLPEPAITPEEQALRRGNPGQYDRTPEQLRALSNVIREGSKSAAPGVFQRKSGRYKAVFRNKTLGTFGTVEEAVAAREIAMDEYYNTPREET